MDTVTLGCKYDLEGEPLYTVKWYKGQKEFYRYIPKELPNTQVFPLPGIDVDLSKSNPNEVVLRNVQPVVTGRYRCEVSTDLPNFYTHMVSSYMYVIDVPEKAPIMTLEKDLLEIGYTIRGNCTTPPSFPPINITWYLNGKKINESYLKHFQPSPDQASLASPDPAIPSASRRMPLITVAGLELEIDDNTFQDGKVYIQCVATLFKIYKQEAGLSLEDARPRPRPSSVLGPRDSSDSPKLRAQLVIVLVLFISRGCMVRR